MTKSTSLGSEHAYFYGQRLCLECNTGCSESQPKTFEEKVDLLCNCCLIEAMDILIWELTGELAIVKQELTDCETALEASRAARSLRLRDF